MSLFEMCTLDPNQTLSSQYFITTIYHFHSQILWAYYSLKVTFAWIFRSKKKPGTKEIPMEFLVEHVATSPIPQPTTEYPSIGAPSVSGLGLPPVSSARIF